MRFMAFEIKEHLNNIFLFYAYSEKFYRRPTEKKGGEPLLTFWIFLARISEFAFLPYLECSDHFKIIIIFLTNVFKTIGVCIN